MGAGLWVRRMRREGSSAKLQTQPCYLNILPSALLLYVSLRSLPSPALPPPPPPFLLFPGQELLICNSIEAKCLVSC